MLVLRHICMHAKSSGSHPGTAENPGVPTTDSKVSKGKGVLRRGPTASLIPANGYIIERPLELLRINLERARKVEL